MRPVPALLLLIGLAAAAWTAPRPAPPAFAGIPVPATNVPASGAEASAVGTSSAAKASETELPQEQPSAHASSLALASDGSVLVAWFAGTREGAADVRIEMARITSGKPPVRWTALTREQLQQGLRRSIRQLGNPVLSRAGDGTLHLVVVSVGGWSGSAINHLTSSDDGRTWSRPRRLVLSPLLNFSSLVRAPALALADGGLGLPAYHECISKWPLWTRLDPSGHVVGSLRMPQPGPALQPAVAALSSESAVAALRRGRGSSPQVLTCRTDDGGAAWRTAPDTGIANPDSGVALVRLADGTLLLACNPLEAGRQLLQLFHSRDGGATWMAGAVVAQGSGGDEFSYPSLLQDGSGAVHLSYTSNRKAIVVRSFSAAWACEAPQ